MPPSLDKRVLSTPRAVCQALWGLAVVSRSPEARGSLADAPLLRMLECPQGDEFHRRPLSFLTQQNVNLRGAVSEPPVQSSPTGSHGPPTLGTSAQSLPKP